ncbi:MAG: hypothetical protein V4717_14560 [Bacteroidota bacterium]
MTLIASTLNYNRPFLLGDLLISSRGTTKSIQLPTNTIDVTQYLDTNTLLAVDLNQKVYIINENVAIALAGVVTEMTEFLKEFTIRCSYYEPIDEAGIRKFIEEYDYLNKFNKSSFFILLMKPEGNLISVKQFWYPEEPWKMTKSEIFEEVYACGTGKDDFLHNTTEQQQFDASSDKGDILRAIAANLGFIAKLLAVERFSLHTIKKNWGGGFETICFDGKSFIKIDEIAYVINYAQFDEDGNLDLPFPQLIQYYKYYKDTLFIVAIEVKKWERFENETEIVLTSNDCRVDIFPVSRLDLPVGCAIQSPPNFSFLTHRLAMGYALITKDNKIFAPSLFMESNNMKVTYEDRKYVELIIDKRMSDLIRSKAKEVYPNI